MMNKTTIWSIIISLTLILGLAGAIALVRTGQDTRSSAAFATGTIGLYPGNYSKTELKVGDEFQVKVKLNTNAAKASGIQTVLCFDSGVSYVSTQALKLTSNIIDKEVAVDGKTCHQFAYVSTSSDEASLPTGVFDVLDIKFKAKTAGTGKIEILPTQTKTVGVNPSSDDKTISLTVDQATTYEIAPTTTCPVAGVCPTQCGQPATQVSDGNCGNKQCGATAACPSTAKILNFKVSFQSVKPTSACAVNMPVSIIVLSAGTTHVYNNIVLTRTNDVSVKGNTVYQGGVALVGVSLPASDVAIFIKGPKHLQIKYGIDGQSAAYNKSAGEINVSSDLNDAKIYNFSNYPLLAGDVTNGNGDSQDGIIDGRDFSYVKSRSIKRETVDNGSYLLGDLDGSCQINSADVTTLMLSLSEKQAQLY